MPLKLKTVHLRYIEFGERHQGIFPNVKTIDTWIERSRRNEQGQSADYNREYMAVTLDTLHGLRVFEVDTTAPTPIVIESQYSDCRICGKPLSMTERRLRVTAHMPCIVKSSYGDK